MTDAPDPSYDEAMKLLAQAARDGKLAAVVAYARMTGRDAARDDGAATKNKGKLSRSQKILDDLEAEPDVDEDMDSSVEDTLADLLARE